MKSKANEPVTDKTMLPKEWEEFCHRGVIPVRWQRASVLRAKESKDEAFCGYYSQLPLNPSLPHTDALYPSHDHLESNKDHERMVVETRLVNDMKSILDEDEFWQMIEHLYAVGLKKKKITNKSPQQLKDDWRPDASYESKKPVPKAEV